MNHHKKTRKFGRIKKVREGLLKSLALSLIVNGKIKTTDAKARELRPFVEKMVTIGVTDNAFYQILSGVTETDDIIADDMTASEEMKKIAKQMAGN